MSLEQRVQLAKEKAASFQGDETAQGDLLKEIRSIPHEGLNKEQVAALSDAVNMISSHTFLAEERDELETLKEDYKDFTKGVADLRSVPHLELSKGSSHLAKSVANLLKKIEGEIHQVSISLSLWHFWGIPVSIF